MTREEKLDLYEKLLNEWQAKINLVASSTLSNSKLRHFEDSAQLSQYIPNGSTVMDMGAGAGFPSLVLAIMRPDLNVHLVESDTRKSVFLRTVSRETVTNVSIHTKRIEEIGDEIAPDIITARALAPLLRLCQYSLKFAKTNPNLQLLFLKGEKTNEEIADAQKVYSFDFEVFQSKTDTSGKVVFIKNLIS